MNNEKIKNLETEADNEPLQIFNLSATAIDLLKCPILLWFFKTNNITRSI